MDAHRWRGCPVACLGSRFRRRYTRQNKKYRLPSGAGRSTYRQSSSGYLELEQKVQAILVGESPADRRATSGSFRWAFTYPPFPSSERRTLHRRLEVLRRVIGTPLDVAAHARSLHGWRRLAGKHCIRCGAQVLTSDRHVVLGTAAVELAAVSEATIAVEQEQIRSAGGLEDFRDVLLFVEQVRERIA